MKIHLISDLHCEFGHYPYTLPAGTDVVIAAGDISVGSHGPMLLRSIFGYDVPIVYIAGNHEHYRQNIHENHDMIEQMAKLHNVHYLNKASVEIAGVTFVGATLWTDFCLYGIPRQFAAMHDASKGINDFRFIAKLGEYKNNGNNPKYRQYVPWTPADAVAEHYDTMSYLNGVLGEVETVNKKLVVVTHMAPTIQSVHPKWGNTNLNAYYASNLDAFIERTKPGLWVHGHTHDPFDYQVGETRVVCNPRGYADRRNTFHSENVSFNPELLLEI